MQSTDPEQQAQPPPGTSLQEQLRRLGDWPPKPGRLRAGLTEDLVRGEFMAPTDRHAIQRRLLARMLTHCQANVPFWRRTFAEMGADVPALLEGGFEELPILTREMVQEHQTELRAERMPRGMRRGLWTKTSGSTGQPVLVEYNPAAMSMYGALKHRKLRWYGAGSDWSQAAIRPAIDLPRLSGRKLEPGQRITLDSWPDLGPFFRTGRFDGFSNSNPVEAQADFLQAVKPQSLLMLASDLEHLALASVREDPPEDLRFCESISQQLTTEMRERVEAAFSVPLYETYGLNEVGIVASQSSSSRELLVHWEHCLVEVTEESGAPLCPGESGRLLVTGLSNFAMPLLRYDTDDLARLWDDRVSVCGRSMPILENLQGRYRRRAQLPPETWGYWDMLQTGLSRMDRGLLGELRQYQLHQFADGTFELRISARSDVAERVGEALRPHWLEAGDAQLQVVQLDEIPRPGPDGTGKFQNFTSDFAPPPS